MEIITLSVIIGVFFHSTGTDLPRALSVSGRDTGERHPIQKYRRARNFCFLHPNSKLIALV
jgi:hypothetical protein